MPACSFVLKSELKNIKYIFMKHLIFSLVVSVFFTMSSFAAEAPVSTHVLQSFEKTFSNAKEVNWTVGKDVYKAEFIYSSQYIAAYYDQEGNLLGLTKNILSTQLPVLLENSLKEGYEGYWIADVIEFSSEDGTVYYATLENGDGKVVLKSSQNSWSLNKKIKK
jgi:hypothetical protein